MSAPDIAVGADYLIAGSAENVLFLVLVLEAGGLPGDVQGVPEQVPLEIPRLVQSNRSKEVLAQYVLFLALHQSRVLNHGLVQQGHFNGIIRLIQCETRRYLVLIGGQLGLGLAPGALLFKAPIGPASLPKTGLA